MNKDIITFKFISICEMHMGTNQRDVLTVSNKVQHIIFHDISFIDLYFMISKGLVNKNFFENCMSSSTNPELHSVSTTSERLPMLQKRYWSRPYK